MLHAPITERRAAHKAKMARKKAMRLIPPGNYATASATYRRGNYGVSRAVYKACRAVPASINRHTDKPHEHGREIARRLAQSAGA